MRSKVTARYPGGGRHHTIQPLDGGDGDGSMLFKVPDLSVTLQQQTKAAEAEQQGQVTKAAIRRHRTSPWRARTMRALQKLQGNREWVATHGDLEPGWVLDLLAKVGPPVTERMKAEAIGRVTQPYGVVVEGTHPLPEKLGPAVLDSKVLDMQVNVPRTAHDMLVAVKQDLLCQMLARDRRALAAAAAASATATGGGGKKSADQQHQRGQGKKQMETD